VGDVDMIYHPNFVETLHNLNDNQGATYFQVGFLSETESKKSKAFGDYEIKFQSNHEATGMTLYDTEMLKSINGYDEFYHGWGSEDTDVHVRLKNAGYNVDFYKENILILHQWHPKTYRSIESKEPFHSQLEQINHQYLEFTRQTKKCKANLRFDWGAYNQSDYDSLNKVDFSCSITNKEAEVKSFVSNVLLSERNKVISVSIITDKNYKSIKQKIKKIFQKKTVAFLEMSTISNLLLECIIDNLRTNAYQFQYNSNKQTIHLTIEL
jgi:predicted glycosyltransferase involved in capsule biosynthesis